jgi:RimJ/RimL family protein N-acetyltransferase
MLNGVKLVPLGRQHLDGVGRLVRDPSSVRHTRIPEPAPPDFPERWLERYEAGRSEGTREAFAIEDETGAFLGVALAPSVERVERSAELGYIVAPEARGRGVGTEALRLLTEWALSEKGAERIELLIAVDNEPSKVVAARCGYVREGVLRSVYVKEGVRDDLEVWSRLPSDPQPA